MNSGTHASVMGNRKNKAVVETVAQIVFTICAFFAVLAVVSITLYTVSYTHLTLPTIYSV